MWCDTVIRRHKLLSGLRSELSDVTRGGGRTLTRARRVAARLRLVEGDALAPRVVVDAAHHRLELLAGAGLDVLGAAERDEVLGALLPLDGLEQLALEEGADLVD